MPTDDKVLAYTVSHGDRRFLRETVPALRGSAGMWFDWAVWLGRPSIDAAGDATALLHKPDRTGIQYLQQWPDNKGQHYATREALALAKAEGYKWLLRLDDDIMPKTKRWLKRMIYTLEELRKTVKDEHYRIVAAPKIIGLRNPLQACGEVSKGQHSTVELMSILGGACRLHPMELMEGYEPPAYGPVGRLDPESIADHVHNHDGFLVRLPNIRVVHRTNVLEAKDSEEMQ